MGSQQPARMEGRRLPLATVLLPSNYPLLSVIPTGAKRKGGICGAPRSLPDLQGQPYRQFRPSLFLSRRHCFYLQTHFVLGAGDALKRVGRAMTLQNRPWMQGPEGRPPNDSPARKGWEINPEDDLSDAGA